VWRRRPPLEVSIRSVRVYYADGCHLCERARSTLAELRHEHEFELCEVDIGGDADLEARYREWLPVVEIDGERAFVYYLDEAAFLRRLGAQSRV
jgi:glutaredoxin